jgi:hypothetical protein
MGSSFEQGALLLKRLLVDLALNPHADYVFAASVPLKNRKLTTGAWADSI